MPCFPPPHKPLNQYIYFISKYFITRLKNGYFCQFFLALKAQSSTVLQYMYVNFVVKNGKEREGFPQINSERITVYIAF